MPNPFTVISGELMAAKDVAKEFIIEHTEHAKLSSYSHTLVWGSRGSGKSIHFKYLEPLAQSYNPRCDCFGDVNKFLTSKNAFLSIYINCRDGILHKEELKYFEDLESVESRISNILLSRYFSAVIIKKFVEVFQTQLKSLLKTEVVTKDLPRWIRQFNANIETLDDLFNCLREHCSKFLHEAVEIVTCSIVDRNFEIPVSKISGFRPEISEDITEFSKFILKILKIDCPIFLLFDEANTLCQTHQKCINTLIGMRTQNYQCIKVASQRNGFNTNLSLSGAVDETHDYTVLDLDGLYTNNRQAYYKRLVKIGNFRLEKSGINVPIESFLPFNEREIKALEKAREIAEERYNSLSPEERPKDKVNFTKKYAPAIFFQEIKSFKTSISYAGFDNIVHMSSGIVRSFLDCCSIMYSEFVENNPSVEPNFIPISIQSKVIKEYSDNFIQAQLIDKIKSLKPKSDDRIKLEQLYSLLKSLGSLFRKRLLDKTSREPRIISVSLKDEASSQLNDILELAEREAFFHVKWYRSKRGDRNLKCYVLNRRLCPHFNLDLSGFQGRIELFSRELEVALESTKNFLRLMSSKGKNNSVDQQLNLFEY